jgi:tetratricopeptide (TPR) repeat protein
MSARLLPPALALFTLVLPFPGPAFGQSAAAPTDLGYVQFATSCSASTTDRFNRAVALLHHMTYPGARLEFAAIAASDSTCAMAHWGIAMTLFQPLWPTRPGAADLRRGWEEVKAAEARGHATDRERMFVASAAAFFDSAVTDYWERIRQWAAATRRLYERYPEDVEARAFFALSLLATAPASGELDNHSEAAALLQTVLREQPLHPGAIHYTIHANDAAGREAESTDVVRGYARVAPRNPHALHMPTHIYVRLGDWPEVIEGNRLAADAALENRAGDAQQWTWDEFPHAIEYLVYALLQVGDDASALEQLRRVERTSDLEPTFKTAFHISSIPARYALERRDWAMAAQLQPRPSPALEWARFPWPEAVTWFARGIGAARSGQLEPARTAEARLGELRDVSKGMAEDLFAWNTEILRLGVAGWIAALSGDPDAAIMLLEQAVELESSTPKHAVTPAPTIPAGELLGDLLLELGRSAAALNAYDAVLVSAPRRLNALVGAARAARQLGDDELAVTLYARVRVLAITDSPRAEVAEAIAFLTR